MPLDAEQLTLLGAAVAIGLAGLKKIWVWGWAYEAKEAELAAMTKDRDFWRDGLLKALTVNDKAIDTAAKTATNGT